MDDYRLATLEFNFILDAMIDAPWMAIFEMLWNAEMEFEVTHSILAISCCR